MNFLSKFFSRFLKTKNSPEKPGELLKEAVGTRLTDKNFDGIVTAKVLEISKHPNADRLRLIKLDIGDKTVGPIVCGAFNFEVGATVALALPGAKIAQDIHSAEHKPFVLEKAKIRGIESQGMICAAFELGLATEPGQGIMLLKNDILPGSQFSAEMIAN